MTRLRRTDLEAVLQAIQTIDACRSLDDFPLATLEVMQQLVPGDLTGYNDLAPDSRRDVVALDQTFSDMPQLLENFGRHVQDHPIVSRHFQGGSEPIRVAAISDFLSFRQFQQLGIYHEFFGKLGYRDQLSASLPMPPPRAVGVAVNRARSIFTSQERLRLDAVLDHLVATYRRLETIARLHAAADRQATALLDEHGQTRFLSPAAADLLTRFTGQPEIPAEVRDWVRGEKARLTVPDDVPERRRPLSLTHDGWDLLFHLAAGARPGDQTLLALERRPGATRRLTPREASILALVAQGLSDAQIAERLTISVRTVTGNLQRIYSKLGVSNRTAAALEAGFIATSQPV